MPELPEVEAARRAIEDHCLGKKIVRSIIADDEKVIEGVSHFDFEASMIGKTIINAHRKGKNMWLQLDSPPFPSFQFGMAGAIYIKGVAVTKYKRSAVKDTDEWPSKYSKFFIELDDGLEFSFTDKRRFARVRLLKDPASAPPISELGPDALLEPRTVDEFCNSITKKKIPIKALLLDQSYISGIGNWIADEVLYQARIHPLQVAASLSKESCEALQNCIREVIGKAIEVGADSSRFPEYWIFHSREKKSGKAFVDGKNIDFITAGGRTTAYVPDLQKLTGPQAVKEPSKPKNQTSRNNRGKNKNDDDNEDETKPNNVKSNKSLNPKRQGKKPPAKRKSEESDDDDDDEDNDDNGDELETDNVKSKKRQNPKNQRKKPPVKTKSKESDDEDDNVEDQKEKTVKVTNKDRKSQQNKKPKKKTK